MKNFDSLNLRELRVQIKKISRNLALEKATTPESVYNPKIHKMFGELNKIQEILSKRTGPAFRSSAPKKYDNKATV